VPLIMFLPITFITDKALYTMAMLVGIHNLVNIPLLCAIFSDNRMWPGGFMVEEEEWVIGDVSFQ
jgi:hypothetical protein